MIILLQLSLQPMAFAILLTVAVAAGTAVVVVHIVIAASRCIWSYPKSYTSWLPKASHVPLSF